MADATLLQGSKQFKNSSCLHHFSNTENNLKILQNIQVHNNKMSNQGGYYQQGGQDHQYQQNLPNSNPWADQPSQAAPPGLQQPLQPQQHQQQQPQQYTQGAGVGGYEAPPGPPPRRTDTFEANKFVPQEERGEQREAMENFEMHRNKPESQTERDVATLQEEFPALDGSLIAAIYGDSQSLSATREMLQELASST